MDSDRCVEGRRGEFAGLMDRASRSGFPLLDELELEWFGPEGGCWDERARDERRGLMVKVDGGDGGCYVG